MNIKCPGCGVLIQTDDSNRVGYIRKEVFEKRKDDFLCERCYRLKHYNEVKVLENNIDIDFDKVFKQISNEKCLIVNIIDTFDLLGSVITDINKKFPKAKVLIVGNKYDLFMRSNRPTKIRSYLKKYLLDKNIDYCDVVVTSSIEDDAGKPIYDYIKKYYNNLPVYFVGMTNVGKSTLINNISKARDNCLNLTTSNQVGTTIDLSKFLLKDLLIGDTPGYYNDKQLTHYLDKKSLNLVMPKKFIKPRVYQLYNNDSIFVSGILSLTYLSEEKAGISFYVANTLMLYRTKNNPNEYFEKHKNDFLSVPNDKERNRLGELKSYEFDIKAGEELAISGVGFINFTRDSKISIMTYSNIELEIRKALI